MKISLVHNPTAGGGQDADEAVALLTEAGHKVRHRSTKGRWKVLLQDPGDLLVAAGGDGTVRKVALAAAEVEVPFAILPIGTANNIAKTLGLMGDARTLVESWSAQLEQGTPFDFGEVNGKWFVESVGGGPIPELIARSDEIEADATLLGRETDRALHLFRELVADAPDDAWRVCLDGADISGEFLAVEVVNIRFVGPNIPIAPKADPTDGLLDVVLIGEAERHRCSTTSTVGSPWPADRCRAAPPRARVIELERRPACACTSMTGSGRSGPLRRRSALEVRCHPGAATLVRPSVPSVDGSGEHRRAAVPRPAGSAEPLNVSSCPDRRRPGSSRPA